VPNSLTTNAGAELAPPSIVAVERHAIKRRADRGQPEQANMTGLKVEVAFGAVAMRSTSVTTITRYAA
jgi:hypothetical protein